MTAITVAYEDTLCHPRKRLRLDSDAASSIRTEDHDHDFATIKLVAMNPTAASPQPHTLATATKVARLESLPGEILDIILNFSAEASLIHTSKLLWQKLPDYVSFAERLAFEALLPLKEWKDTDEIACPLGSNIAEVQSYLSLNSQSVIQEKTFSTYWFKEEHINYVRQILLRWTILKACAVYFERSPSPSQMKRIKSFVENQRTPNIGTDLNLRLRCENSRLVYLTATAFEVEVSERRNSFYQAFEFRVLDFGNAVPDFLLQHPLTPAKQATIRGICKWKDTRRQVSPHNWIGRVGGFKPDTLGLCLGLSP